MRCAPSIRCCASIVQVGEPCQHPSADTVGAGEGAGGRPAAGRPSQGARAESARISASVLRRDAAARHDRHGTGAGAGAADRRRADNGARRHGAGAGAEAAARDPRQPRHGDPVHHPRSRRHRRAVRLGLCHVCRRRAGAGAGRAACSRSRPIPTRRCCCARRPPCARCRRSCVSIPGQIPQPFELPAGCRFADRCPHRFARCASEPPHLQIEAEHTARCWLLRNRAPLQRRRRRSA